MCRPWWRGWWRSLFGLVLLINPDSTVFYNPKLPVEFLLRQSTDECSAKIFEVSTGYWFCGSQNRDAMLLRRLELQGIAEI